MKNETVGVYGKTKPTIKIGFGNIEGDSKDLEKLDLSEIEALDKEHEEARIQGLMDALGIKGKPRKKLAESKQEERKLPSAEAVVDASTSEKNPIHIDNAKRFLAERLKLNNEVAAVGFSPRPLGGIKKYWGDALPADPGVYQSILTNSFGDFWPTWDPETIDREVEINKLYNNGSVLVSDMVSALQIIWTHQGFWDDWFVFQNVTLALNGYGGNFKVVQPPSPAQMAYAINFVNEVRPIGNFHPDVLKFIAGSCRWHGLNYCVGELSPAEEYMRTIVGSDDDDFIQTLQRSYSGVLSVLTEKKKTVQDLYESLDLEETYKEIQLMTVVAMAIYVFEKLEARKSQLYGGK